MYHAQIAHAVTTAVFGNFLVATTVAAMVVAVATPYHEVTLQASAPEQRCPVAEKNCQVAAVVLATTKAR